MEASISCRAWSGFSVTAAVLLTCQNPEQFCSTRSSEAPAEFLTWAVSEEDGGNDFLFNTVSKKCTSLAALGRTKQSLQTLKCTGNALTLPSVTPSTWSFELWFLSVNKFTLVTPFPSSLLPRV